MGQAKIRREEINALKAKSTFSKGNVGDQIYLIAIKHCKNGVRNIAVIDLKVTVCDRSRDQLLHDICTQSWGERSLFQKIANYMSMSSNYQLFKTMGVYGYAINFYESDRDFDGAYSCREITAISTKESFDAMAHSYVEEATSMAMF